MPFINSILSNDEENSPKQDEQLTNDEKPTIKINKNDNVSVLNKTAHKLFGSTDDGLAAIEELKTTMESIAAAAEESAGAAEESLGAVNEIKQNSSAILKMSSQSAEVIKGVEESILKASNKITESSENMLKIAKSAEHVSEVGDRLSIAGNEISKTVNLITKLAKRTSLLALNAAIEATRAKEKGKSFSVMAKEIRALSAKSNNYAQEIKSVVEEIQTNVTKVQSTIVKTKDLVEDSSHKASENASSMKDLINNLIRIVEDVKESLEEFKILDDEIVKMQLSSETIASAAEESAGAISEVTQTISMQATAFKQSNAAAVMLQDLAKKIEEDSSDESVVNDLASAAEELSSAIEEIENSMSQSMIALSQIKEAAEISEDDAKKNEIIAKEAQELTKRIKKIMAKVNSDISQIQNSFDANVTTIAEAGVSSKENLQSNDLILQEAKGIKKSIKYLKKILRKIELTIVQTAALSINGSVEAMRVGELGEGFSIVSNDIRNLAENSEQNLDQINDIVDNLEDETESIIEAITQMQYLGIKEADALVVLASDMDTSKKEIAYSVGVFEEMAQKLDDIDNALSQAQIGAEQTVTAANLSLNNAAESTEAAEHITKISQNMAENVSELIEVAALLKDS